MKKICIAICFIFMTLFKTTDSIIIKNDSKPVVEVKEYLSGIVEIDSINLKTNFYDNNNLDNNVIVIQPSSESLLILAGHSGYGPTAFFKDLYKIRVGETIKIMIHNRVYKYKLKKIEYQLKTGKIKVHKIKDINTLVLITCTKNNKKMQTVYTAALY